MPVNYDHTLLDEGLWDHQRDRADKYKDVEGHIHIWEPRTGKTRLTHKQMVHWINELGYTKILITAPQTVCDDIWIQETRAAFPFEGDGSKSLRILRLYAGKLTFRQSILEAEINSTQNRPTVIVVNRDSLHKLQKHLIRWNPDVFVLDELHDYKTAGSYRGRAAYEIGKRAKIRRGLTGTIMTRNYGDIYGQAKIIRSEVFGTQKEIFEDRYITFSHVHASQVIGYKNIAELRDKLADLSDKKMRSECFDIPEEVLINKKLNLPLKIKALYNEIAKKHVYEQDGKLLSVDHALARLTLLQQLAGGSLKRSDGTYEWVHDTLLDAAEEETLEVLESGNKNIIFYRFDQEGEKLIERLSKHGAVLLNGSVRADQRSPLIKRFQDHDSDCRVLIVQEAIGSVGLSFAVTNYVTFYSTSASYGIHKQAKDRIFAPNTSGNLKLVYTYLQARGTVHTWIAGLIRAKQSASDVLLTESDFQYAAFGGEDAV